jgi:hypothetical protein
MVDQLASWIDNQVEGATIYGPSRFGKSSAVDHWVQTLLSQRYKSAVPMQGDCMKQKSQSMV